MIDSQSLAHRDDPPRHCGHVLRSGTRSVDTRETQGGRLSSPSDKIKSASRAYLWNWIGFALSATIVGISIYVLAHILRDIDVPRVIANVRAMPASRIGWAVVC